MKQDVGMPLDATKTPEAFQSFGRGTLPDHLGIRVTEVREGSLRAELTVAPHHLAPNGYLHAASVIALADTAAGYATIANLPAGATSFTTIELKCNFLGTAKTGATVACHAVAAHLGRTTQLWDVTVTLAEKPIALFRCTQMVLWPKP